MSSQEGTLRLRVPAWNEGGSFSAGWPTIAGPVRDLIYFSPPFMGASTTILMFLYEETEAQEGK